MKKYVAYYRVSTKQQGLGLEAQRSQVLAFISSSTDNILLKEYSEKESGKNNDRVELQSAIRYAKENSATLLIAKLDRLSRTVSFIFHLYDSKIDFLALDLPSCNTLTLGVCASVAQFERELISSRTKAALAELKAKGVKLGNPRPHNFTTEQQIKSKEIITTKANNNENNLKAKLMIESLLKEGKKITEITKYLNDNNFKTSTGKEFQIVQVQRIIKRYNLI
ncbi:DNA-invertase hin [termite gut metagenome]|uniref:DNA-invertase hin n=1 Tax=termite gut metagenome TaxID=433724 RepID=A0A5J4S874_9ZZZZ